MERTTTAELGQLEKKLSSWRERYGGRGRPIPEELWAEAAGVAAIAGVAETARVLCVDRDRLARRVSQRASNTSAAVLAQPSRRARASAVFVEVDAPQVFTRSKSLVRLTSRDGEQLEVEVEGNAMEVAAVARALWRRAR
jgi:hypothetical protein